MPLLYGPAVDRGAHLQVEGLPRPAGCQLVRRDQPGPEAGRGVLRLDRPQGVEHLPRLQVAGAPVAEEQVPGDVLLGLVRGQVGPGAPDDGGELQLEVVLDRSRRHGHVVPRGPDGGRVLEVEDRQLVPVGVHLLAVGLAVGAHVRLEGVEVPHRGRHRNRRQELRLPLRDHVQRIGQGLLPRPRQQLAVVPQEVDQPVGRAQAVQRAVGQHGRVLQAVGGRDVGGPAHGGPSREGRRSGERGIGCGRGSPVPGGSATRRADAG